MILEIRTEIDAYWKISQKEFWNGHPGEHNSLKKIVCV